MRDNNRSVFSGNEINSDVEPKTLSQVFSALDQPSIYLRNYEPSKDRCDRLQKQNQNSILKSELYKGGKKLGGAMLR